LVAVWCLEGLEVEEGLGVCVADLGDLKLLDRMNVVDVRDVVATVVLLYR